MKTVMVGAGNLACNLGSVLKAAGHEVVCVYSRTEASASYLAGLLECPFETDITRVPTDADLYVYALKDDVLQAVSQRVVAPAAIHVHTAGGVPLSALSDKERRGVLYPLQTFSKQRVVNFRPVPLFVEAGDACTRAVLLGLAGELSARVYEADSHQRKLLHVAAVFACNFVNCMYANAHRIVRSAGLPFEVLLPLIDETAGKVHQLPPEQAQTGPAVRNDRMVMEGHVADLDSELQRRLYRLVSEDIYVHSKSIQ